MFQEYPNRLPYYYYFYYYYKLLGKYSIALVASIWKSISEKRAQRYNPGLRSEFENKYKHTHTFIHSYRAVYAVYYRTHAVFAIAKFSTRIATKYVVHDATTKPLIKIQNNWISIQNKWKAVLRPPKMEKVTWLNMHLIEHTVYGRKFKAFGNLSLI